MLPADSRLLIGRHGAQQAAGRLPGLAASGGPTCTRSCSSFWRRSSSAFSSRKRCGMPVPVWLALISSCHNSCTRSGGVARRGARRNGARPVGSGNVHACARHRRATSERAGSRTLQNRLVFFSRNPVRLICSCRGSTVCMAGAGCVQPGPGRAHDAGRCSTRRPFQPAMLFQVPACHAHAAAPPPSCHPAAHTRMR